MVGSTRQCTLGLHLLYTLTETQLTHFCNDSPGVGPRKQESVSAFSAGFRGVWEWDTVALQLAHWGVNDAIFLTPLGCLG